MNLIGLTPNNALLTLIGQVPGGWAFIIGVHGEIKVKVHRQSFLPEGSQHLFFLNSIQTSLALFQHSYTDRPDIHSIDTYTSYKTSGPFQPLD